jgi:opacity protein-like surface antigen
MRFPLLVRFILTGALATAVVAPAAAQNYDGAGLLRVGAFAQGSWIDAGFKFSDGVTNTAGSTSIDGFGGGISFGYDHRLGGMILGVEADVSFDNASKVVGVVDVGIDYFATLRGRIGFDLRPGLLVYATGGFAALGGEGVFDPGTGRVKVAKTLTGGVVGGGIEAEWHHVIVFAEYLYASFDSQTFVFDTARTEIDADDHVFRVGVKFKYGHDHAHGGYDRHRGHDPLK